MAQATTKAAATAEPARTIHISVKVSEKGAVSVYGLQRFPVSLYADQWEAILSRADALRKFIADNRAQLKAAALPGGSVGATPL